MERQVYKNVSKNGKFSLQQILSDNPNFLVEQMRGELELKKPKCADGSLIRISTIRAWCDLLERQNRTLEELKNMILDLKEMRK